MKFNKVSQSKLLSFLVITGLTLISFKHLKTIRNSGKKDILFCIIRYIKQEILEMDLAKSKKYVGCSIYEAGGLGNQLWRLASLYGIGKITNRMPYFEPARFKPVKGTALTFMNLTEISTLFPEALKMFKIINTKSQQTIITDFANTEKAVDCCKYENPEKLKNVYSKFLLITGNYLQSYKFFKDYESRIKKFFECSPLIMDSIKKYANSLFKNDNDSHKICVHIRRGDFMEDEMLESKSDFVKFSIKYVQKYFYEKNVTNQSLLFIGNDDSFVESLKLKKENNKIYNIKTESRGEDLCFGINFCDSIILTASGSTFGWWMAYLKKSKGPVFYNSQVTDYGNHTKDKYYFDLFPPKWIKLTHMG